MRPDPSADSAHADQADLLRFATGMKPPPKVLRLVHGDDDAKQQLATLARHRLPGLQVLVRRQRVRQQPRRHGPTGAGGLQEHQPGHRPAMVGQDHRLALLRQAHQFRQTVFCIQDIHLHPANIASNLTRLAMGLNTDCNPLR